MLRTYEEGILRNAALRTREDMLRREVLKTRHIVHSTKQRGSCINDRLYRYKRQTGKKRVATRQRGRKFYGL
jgi:hypothetical protein